MSANTRDSICEAALTLFGQRGYADTSLRDIAQEADIAIGSLTYHFSKKEDLLNYMLADLHAGFLAVLNRSLRGNALLAALLDLFSKARENQQRYTFYFRHINSIMRESKAQREENALFERHLISYYEQSLAILEDDGIVRPLGATARSRVAALMVSAHASWLTASSPTANGAVDSFGIDVALATLLRCLLQAGELANYDALCAERKINLN